MKSILISIRPQWVAKILNGKKTIEVRRSKPKRELPIDVLIYCTNDSRYMLDYAYGGDGHYLCRDKKSPDYPFRDFSKDYKGRFNGKVVGKFRLEKIDCLRFGWERNPYFSGIGSATCLSVEETKKYLNGKIGYLWHISDLEIFDEPKELGEFSYLVRKFHVDGFVVPLYGKVAKAPQSWQYVEVEE